ncbi:MAG: flagellar biosynthesis protein FlhB [Alphaproteobacteria bacterium]|nr:flagellar biosynthesis protein FlhB [Alphaproteobacteria bacterium]
MAGEQDESSKTEDPTAKRLEEARKRGQVAVSREVNSWFVLLAATIALGALGSGLATQGKAMVETFAGGAHLMRIEPSSLQAMAADICIAMALAAGPVLVAGTLAGIAAGLVQVGWLFAPGAMKPEWSKISPLKGLQRLFSAASLVEFAKGIVKMVLVGWACWYAVEPSLADLPLFALREIPAALNVISDLSMRLLIAAVAVMALIAAIDFGYQKLRIMREMRMSRTEIRDEFKEQEGDPMVKAKLRQIRQERSRRRMMAAVPKADVVITNPTHYAVALKYDRDAMAAPVVVAKGTDDVALRIRQLAKESGVPIVENPPLARALHATVDLDRAIEPEHYKAVAEIISYVWKLRPSGHGSARPS